MSQAIKTRSVAGYLENEMGKPIVELFVPATGHCYRIWADGRYDGFPDGTVIANGILPLLHCAQSLERKAFNNGLIPKEQIADLFM